MNYNLFQVACKKKKKKKQFKWSNVLIKQKLMIHEQ